MSPSNGWRGITRRGFLLGSATGLAAGAAGGWFVAPHLSPLLEPPPRRGPRAADGMPGPYPGRVVEVRHPGVVSADHGINAEAVGHMVDCGMSRLTGAERGDVRGAWGRFFDKEDVVGIKVNPVGRKPEPGEEGRVPGAVGSISSPALLVKVVRCLRALGIPARNIIVFERYAEEFERAGYRNVVENELPGVRWYASSLGYSDSQLDVAGFDQGRDAAPGGVAAHVAGYDPEVFTVMGFCAPWHSRHDERRFRTHLSAIVTRMVSKVINLPVLKDHRSAGVTLALKNLSHGMNNNVSRSHLSDIPHGLGWPSENVSGPNQCNTFIPQAAGQLALRQKVVLHILDGLIGVYEGGPGNWNRTWGTWHHQGLFFATDPVALDHVGWDAIDRQRARMGWPPVERMGLVQRTPQTAAATALAPLAAASPAGALALTTAADNIEGGRSSELFALRQPEHVTLAGIAGLGVFDREQIVHEVVSRQ
jgi:hypothetical protein